MQLVGKLSRQIVARELLSNLSSRSIQTALKTAAGPSTQCTSTRLHTHTFFVYQFVLRTLLLLCRQQLGRSFRNMMCLGGLHYCILPAKYVTIHIHSCVQPNDEQWWVAALRVEAHLTSSLPVPHTDITIAQHFTLDRYGAVLHTYINTTHGTSDPVLPSCTLFAPRGRAL